MRALLAAAAALLLGCGGPSAARLSSETLADGSERIVGEFRVSAGEPIAWAVLTDYEHLPRFVTEVRESRVLRRSGPRLLVRQATRIRWLWSRRTWAVRLHLEERRPTIRFEDESLSDFERYRGDWTVSGEGAGVVVRYRLEAIPRESPRFLSRRALLRAAGALLEQARVEILRRERAKRI